MAFNDYWTLKENLLSKSRDVNGTRINNDTLLEVMLKASQLGLLDQVAGHYGIMPSLAVTVLSNRLSKGQPLRGEGKDFEGLLGILLEDDSLRKSLSEDGVDLPDLPGTDFVAMRDADREHKQRRKAPLQKSREQQVAESSARARILDALLNLRREGLIAPLDLTKSEMRLNKHMTLAPHVRAALKAVGGGADVELLEKSWGIDNTWAPLMKGQNERGYRDGSGPYQGSAQARSSSIGKRMQAGEDCPIRVENRDGSSREIPARKIREELNRVAMTKGRTADLPISQVETLLNKTVQGSAAAKQQLEGKYGYFLQGLFE